MALTETNFKARILAFRDHASTPADVKAFLTRVVEDDPSYYGEGTAISDRVDTLLNQSADRLTLPSVQFAVDFVRNNRDLIPD